MMPFAVSAENDSCGAPERAVVHGLDALALVTPPPVLQAYATSSAGLSRLSVLVREPHPSSASAPTYNPFTPGGCKCAGGVVPTVAGGCQCVGS